MAQLLTFPSENSPRSDLDKPDIMDVVRSTCGGNLLCHHDKYCMAVFYSSTEAAEREGQAGSSALFARETH